MQLALGCLGGRGTCSSTRAMCPSLGLAKTLARRATELPYSPNWYGWYGPYVCPAAIDIPGTAVARWGFLFVLGRDWRFAWK